MSTESQRQPDLESKITRTSSPYLDSILGIAFPVLDHGFNRIIDYMGDDQAVKDAAQTSYKDGHNKLTSGLGVLNYLMRHKHTSPFEMCELKMHQQLPLFVARQWIRHRTSNVNEFSGRYSIMPDLFYVPPLHRIQKQSTTNKQGSEGSFDPETAELLQNKIRNVSKQAFMEYQLMATPIKDGGIYEVSKEISRLILPQNIYTQWYWKQDLHNLFHLIMLRADSHAQWEIQEYAKGIWAHVRQWVPVSARAFDVYRMHSETFSTHELSALALLIDNDQSRIMMQTLHDLDVEGIAAQTDGKFSQGEWKELLNKMDILASKISRP